MAKQNGKYDWNCVQFTSVDKKTLKDDCTIRKGDETNRGKSGPLHCAIKIVTLVQTKFIIVILENWIFNFSVLLHIQSYSSRIRLVSQWKATASFIKKAFKDFKNPYFFFNILKKQDLKIA